MATQTRNLEVKGLGRIKLDRLAKKAGRLGLTSAGYVKQLVEEDLAVSEEARVTTFAGVMGSAHDVDEKDLDQLVERARVQHHGSQKKKRR